MSKQKNPIQKKCQSNAQCKRAATIGVYTWQYGESDVNLDRPLSVFCGRHKRRLHRDQSLRNVELVTS